MSQDLGTLTSDAGFSPRVHVSVNGRLHVALDDHPSSGSNPGMAKLMKGVKDDLVA